MNQEYMGITSKVGHDPILARRYDNICQALGYDSQRILALIEQWMDDSDLESITKFLEDNY